MGTCLWAFVRLLLEQRFLHQVTCCETKVSNGKRSNPEISTERPRELPGTVAVSLGPVLLRWHPKVQRPRREIVHRFFKVQYVLIEHVEIPSLWKKEPHHYTIPRKHSQFNKISRNVSTSFFALNHFFGFQRFQHLPTRLSTDTVSAPLRRKVPVRPRPLRQCTAKQLLELSQVARNSCRSSMEGQPGSWTVGVGHL